MNRSFIAGLVPDIVREAVEKGRLNMPVSGNSMAPILFSSDKITIVKCDADSLWPGDIVLYTEQTEKPLLIVHRFIRRIRIHGRNMIITKGDSCRSCDKPIGTTAILGRIIEVKKRKLNIRFDRVSGRILNWAVLFLSITNIIHFVSIILLKIKTLENDKAKA